MAQQLGPEAESADPSGGGRRGPAGGSSRFRGVTRHRRTRRWEAHIWENKKQLYLGGARPPRAQRGRSGAAASPAGGARCRPPKNRTISPPPLTTTLHLFPTKSLAQ